MVCPHGINGYRSCLQHSCFGDFKSLRTHRGLIYREIKEYLHRVKRRSHMTFRNTLEGLNGRHSKKLRPGDLLSRKAVDAINIRDIRSLYSKGIEAISGSNS